MNRTLLATAAASALGASPAAAGPGEIAGVQARLSATPVVAMGACPQTVNFDGQVAVHARFPPGRSARFAVQFKRSDGGIAPISYFSVSGSGGKHAVSDTWVLGGAALPTYSGWERIKTWPTAGGHPAVFSDKAAFTMECHVRRPGRSHGERP
jgi:hypothetical protein